VNEFCFNKECGWQDGIKIRDLANSHAQSKLWISAKEDAVHKIVSEYKLCYALLVEMNEYLNINKMTNIASDSGFHRMIKERVE